MNPKHISISPLFYLAGILLCAQTNIAHALPTDKNQPITISADNASLDQKQGVVVYSGAVKLSQGSMVINAEKITLRTDRNQKVDTMLAEGSPARYQQQPEINKATINAEATSISYSVKKEHLTLDKNAFVEQNGATTRGGRIDYDMASGTVKASGAGNQSGRVEFVIPPQTDKKE